VFLCVIKTENKAPPVRFERTAIGLEVRCFELLDDSAVVA